jgi:sialic acid synthase SpsE
MRVNSFDVDKEVLVVAEIGNNHEGSLEVAKEMVRRAADSGAHAVKFQTFRTEHFVSVRDRARFERLKSFELSFQGFEDLHDLARSLGLLFLSTPLDLESARFLARLVDAFKIASGDNHFFPLLEVVCASGKPVVVSSGLSDLDHIHACRRFIDHQWSRRGISQELAILHCVSSYPVPPEQANLLAIKVLAETTGCTVGYSDHTLGIEACVLAVALGARIIEKHFTLDHNYSDFRDHRLSANPAEMRELVRRVREASVLLGTLEKKAQECEAPAAPLIRRSIVAARDLDPGHRLTLADLTWIRPADGLAPGDEQLLLGRRLRRSFAFGEPLRLADVE